MSKKLLDLSESSDEEVEQFGGNTDFAKNYDNWRRKEELQKLKDKYGSNLDVLSDSEQSFKSGSDEESDDSESESEESVDKNEQIFDENFFKVYSALKNKNPIIYDKNFKFFNELKNDDKSEDNLPNETKKKKEKTMTLTDYHIKLVKEKKGITDEDLQQMNGSDEKPVGYYEELDQIRDEFKTIINLEPTEEDSDEDLIKGKPQTASPPKEKRVNLLDDDNDVTKDNPDLNYLKNYWKNEKQLEESELFLRDYIINKRYVDELEAKEDELYRKPNLNETQVSDNESNDENDVNNGFETIDDMNKNKDIDIKINDFHFEDPNAMSLKRFPRDIETIRDTTDSDKRALKRSETKDRKKREKEKELKRLRKLKKDELKQKLVKIQEISGNQNMDWNDLDLNVILDDDKDFDADKYDQKMQSLFGNDYYDNNSKTKPKFEYIPEIDDDLQDIDNRDNDPTETTNDNKSKNNKMMAKKKKKISKTMEEIGIFEDLIGGDLATRYRYRTVETNDFGLTDEEILYSDDKELNQWCSLKKMSQYREDNEERYDQKSYSTKAKNLELKRKILKSFYEKPLPEQNSGENQSNLDTNNDNQSIDNNESNDNTKKRKKRRHKKPKFTVEDIVPKQQTQEEVDQQNGDKTEVQIKIVDNKKKSNKNKRFRGKKQKQNTMESPYPGVSVERLKAYGLSNRKIKKIKHKSKK